MNDSTPEWCWFACSHSLFLTRILLVVTSDPHMFFFVSNTLTHPIFVLLGLSLYKHIFLLHFNPNYDRLMFPTSWVIHNFIAVFQKIETTPNSGPTNLICTFLMCFVQNVNKWAENTGPGDQSLLGYHSISPSFPSHLHYPQIFHPVVFGLSRQCGQDSPLPPLSSERDYTGDFPLLCDPYFVAIRNEMSIGLFSLQSHTDCSSRPRGSLANWWCAGASSLSPKDQ